MVFGLVLAVFFLYVRTLDAQSLWFDEGLSVAFASRPLPQLMHTLIYEDLHPPLYYLLLHFWMSLAGNGEWAVRLPSALAGVLLVPLAFGVVREVWGNDKEHKGSWAFVGTAAAALVATSPFIAFYAQETRMYSIAAALALATTWAFLRATRTSSAGWWLTFSGLLAASLYTQYFSAFILPAFWLYALLLNRRSLGGTAVGTVLAALLYLPWVHPAFLQMQRLLRAPDYWVTTRVDPVLFARALWETFLPNATARAGVAAAVATLLLLLRLLQQRGVNLSQRGRRSALVFLTFLIPLAMTYAAVAMAPKFAARYAIVTAAPLYVCASLILYAVLGQRSTLTRGLFTLLIIGAAVFSLHSAVDVVVGRAQGRDDARALAAYLTANAQTDDALLLVESAPYALQYYYAGVAPSYGLHVGQDFEGAAVVLNRILDTRPRRVWLVLWHHEFADPTDMVVTELLRAGHEVAIARQFRGYQLRAFDIQDDAVPVVARPRPETVLDASFWPGLRLIGFDRLDHDQGRLHYVLYWEAQKQLDREYSATLSFEDGEGNEYLRLDQALSTPYFLPPVWPSDIPIRGRVDVPLPADLPPITYQVRLRVLDPESGRNLDLIDVNDIPIGQSLLLEEVALPKAAMDRAPVDLASIIEADVGSGLELVSFSLTRSDYLPGDTLRLTLWWRSAEVPPLISGSLAVQEESARFSLVDSDNTTVWQDEGPIVDRYPISQWQPGEINRSIYRLTIPSHLQGGRYHLQAGVGDVLIALASLDIVPRQHQYAVPLMQQPLGVQFEEGITLLGYDLQARRLHPGQSIAVTLYWRSREPITTSYKVSVQLLSPNMRISAQDDSVPVQWTYPTSAWLPGEIITDEHILTIPPTVAPDSHLLITVLYEEQSGRRLRVEQAGKTDDHVILTALDVEQ